MGRGLLGDIVHRGVEIVLGHHAKIGGAEAMNLKSNVRGIGAVSVENLG